MYIKIVYIGFNTIKSFRHSMEVTPLPSRQRQSNVIFETNPFLKGWVLKISYYRSVPSVAGGVGGRDKTWGWWGMPLISTFWEIEAGGSGGQAGLHSQFQVMQTETLSQNKFFKKRRKEMLLTKYSKAFSKDQINWWAKSSINGPSEGKWNVDPSLQKVNLSHSKVLKFHMNSCCL